MHACGQVGDLLSEHFLAPQGGVTISDRANKHVRASILTWKLRDTTCKCTQQWGPSVWISEDLNAINWTTFSVRMRKREEAWKIQQLGPVSRSLPPLLIRSAPLANVPQKPKLSMPRLLLKTGRAQSREELQDWCRLFERSPNLARPNFSIEVTGAYGEKIGKSYQEYFRCLAEFEKLRASNATAFPDLIPLSADAVSKAFKAATTLSSNNLLSDLARRQLIMVEDRELVEALLRFNFECVERGGGVTRLQIRSVQLLRRRRWLGGR
jgi:hypothetical protein